MHICALARPLPKYTFFQTSKVPILDDLSTYEAHLFYSSQSSFYAASPPLSLELSNSFPLRYNTCAVQLDSTEADRFSHFSIADATDRPHTLYGPSYQPAHSKQ